MKHKLPQSPPSNGATSLAVNGSKVRLRRAYGVALISAMALAGTAQAAVTQIGNRVWNDINPNNVQDAGEPGVPGIQVILFRDTLPPAGTPNTPPTSNKGIVVASKVTDAAGNYSFDAPTGTNLFLQFIVPDNSGMTFVTPNSGGVGSTAINSKVTSGTRGFGTTNAFSLTEGTPNLNLDAGVKIPANTLVYCDGLGPLEPTDLSKTYLIPKFDTALGTLDEVRLTNYLSTEQSVTATATVGGGGHWNYILSNVTGTLISPGSNTTVVASASTGPFDLLGGQTFNSGLIYGTSTGTNGYFSSPDVDPFIGTGNISFPFSTLSDLLISVTGGGNSNNTQSTQATGGVCVIYKYTPPVAYTDDYGDLPDTIIGVKAGTATTPPDYNTTINDGGPSHLVGVGPTVYLGAVVPDIDNGALQNSAATADDLDPVAGVDDEDGIAAADMPTLVTTSTSVSLKVKTTNGSLNPALLAAWIDFNHNGVFEATELKTISVPAGTSGVIKTLSFTGLSGLTEGPVGLRLRITTEAAWLATPTPTGTANDGEVEDYIVNIYKPCTLSQPIGAAPTQAPPNAALNGMQFTVSAGGLSPLKDIASLTCQKTVNINPTTGISFVPGATTGPLGTPPSWTFPNYNSLQVTAYKAAAGSATLACTVADSDGKVCAVDPIIELAVRIKGQPLTVAVLDGGKPLSANFQYVKIENGSPGVNQLEFIVNGKKFKLPALKDNGIYFLNIGSALRSDVANSVTFSTKGIPDSSASVFIADEPLQ